MTIESFLISLNRFIQTTQWLRFANAAPVWSTKRSQINFIQKRNEGWNGIIAELQKILNSSTICYFFFVRRHQLALNFIFPTLRWTADCVFSFPHSPSVCVSIYYYETRPHINHAKRSEIVIHIIYVLFRIIFALCCVGSQ